MNTTTTLENRLNASLLILRVTVGFIVLAHGVQKLFGWFGGDGYSATMNFFTDYLGLPYLVGLAIILAESFGMVALISGLFTRFFSAVVILIMGGAVLTMHAQYGFYMNWGGAKKGEGFEFHIALIAMAAINLVFGAGSYSLEKWINRRIWSKRMNDGMFFI